jgi:DNA repair protein RadC
LHYPRYYGKNVWKEGTEVTKRLKAAGILLGIKLVDDGIFGKKGYYSLLEHREEF